MKTKIIIINDKLVKHREEFEIRKEEIDHLLANFEKMELNPANRSYVRMMAAKINITLQDIDSNLRNIAFAYDIAEQYADLLLNAPSMNNTIVVDEIEDNSTDTSTKNEDT